LIAWIEAFKEKPKRTFIVHGDKDVAPWFASFVTRTLGIDAYAPKFSERFDLLDEASLPIALPVDDIVVPYIRQLRQAVTLLEKQQQTLLDVVARMQEAGSQPLLEQKRAVRLTNAINRLASDLEFLGLKWGGDDA